MPPGGWGPSPQPAGAAPDDRGVEEVEVPLSAVLEEATLPPPHPNLPEVGGTLGSHTTGRPGSSASCLESSHRLPCHIASWRPPPPLLHKLEAPIGGYSKKGAQEEFKR